MPGIDYHAKAAEVLALAEIETNPAMRRWLESIATIYQRLADQTNLLATLEPTPEAADE